MSYIPNVREKYSTLFNIRNNEGKKNAYWQGYLNDSGVDVLVGFDSVIDTIANFETELELNAFEDELKEGLENKILEKYGIDRRYSALEIECFSEFLSEFLEEHLVCGLVEADRDDLVVSMIDSMRDKEYEHIVKEVDSGRRKHIYTHIDE